MRCLAVACLGLEPSAGPKAPGGHGILLFGEPVEPLFPAQMPGSVSGTEGACVYLGSGWVVQDAVQRLRKA